MINLRKILVPTDFSEHAEKAVQYGVELSAQFGGELHLLHVVEPPPIMYGEGAGYFSTETMADHEAIASKHLAEIDVDVPEGVDLTRKVVQGHAFVEIVRYAKANDTDLVVMGTHGRGAIKHLLLGSVAEMVARKAPCPVLVVRANEHDFVMP